jgi:hypothetical protein
MLMLAYGAVVLLAGCFPEDSLDWSADGSVGLLCTDEALYLVDGQTGRLALVQGENVMAWPGLSRDGTQIVHSSETTCATLAEGWRTLPAGQRKMIENDAQSMRDKILSGALTVTDFNSIPDGMFAHGEPYRSWVVRTLCENADETLVRKLGDELLQQGKKSKLDCCQLIVVPRADLNRKRIVLTSTMPIFRPRFSPDGRHAAYLIMAEENAERADLFVASLQQDMSAVHVASRVALGFDWRDDSRAIAYLQQESGDTILGVIFERQVRDSNGKLLEEMSADASGNPLERHHCTGETKQLAGTLFDPLVKVAYGVGERLFFSSASGRIPTSDLDEPKYMLFCYDFVTGTVVEVLPSEVAAYIGQALNFFSLSPDGRRVLLPMPNNRFAIYELGTKSPEVPILETEQFGEDLPKFLPSWKGNDRVSCLVSEESRFLTSDEEQPHPRKEVIMLDATGKYQSTLSADWPDDAIPGE